MRCLASSLVGVYFVAADNHAATSNVTSTNADENMTATNVTEVAPEPELTAGGVSIRILGQSGKFRMFSTDAGPNDSNMVTIEMDSLTELDADGNAVGSSGQERHSIQTFANQDFTFHPLVTDHMMGVNNTVTANKLSFQSAIGDVGNISVDTFIMRSRGMVGPEGEEWSVGVGDMKFNVNFPDWKWCGDAGSNCRSGEVGEFLELDIKIKGAASEVNLVPGTLNTYNLGGDANLTLTDKVMLDGVQSQMPALFPSLRMQGSSQIFTFRFPKFLASASYDPLLSQGWSDEETTTEETSTEETSTGETSTGAPEGEGTDLSAGGVTVRILGQSGKFRMFSTDAGQSDSNVVTIEMDSLTELDADGNAVGSSGQEKHSIQTFANQDFTFNPMVSNHMMGVNQSVSANKLSFQSTIGDVGNIAVDTFIMSSPGMVGPEGEEWTVGVGDMKFNIRFPSWKWCGDAGSNCRTGEVGEFLELDIKIKGAASEVNLVPGTLNTYNLGGDANLTLTDKVMLDGVQRQMPALFPSLRMQGSSQIFTFRFPKFTASAEYDPLLSQGWHWGQFNNIDGAMLSGASGGLLSMVAIFLMSTSLAFSL